uniref:Uncharacterized protein n=1 Tax=Setaria viridis TaxID=4556 RepID=A0A4U6T279_SETVI|nr:hypothetical protein SEVIR_9G057850v2 [Setaria viridis]
MIATGSIGRHRLGPPWACAAAPHRRLHLHPPGNLPARADPALGLRGLRIPPLMLGPGPSAPALVAGAGEEEWCAWMGRAQVRRRKEHGGPPPIRRGGGRSSSSRRCYFALGGRRRKHPSSLGALERGSGLLPHGRWMRRRRGGGWWLRVELEPSASGLRHPWLSAMECLDDLGGDWHHQMVILPRLTEELYEL